EATATAYTASGLDPESDYAFRVCASEVRTETDGTFLYTSAGATVLSRTMAPDPVNISSTALDEPAPGTFHASWQPAANATHYLVCFALTSADPLFYPNCSCASPVSVNTTEVSFTGLTPGTYGIRTCSANDGALNPI